MTAALDELFLTIEEHKVNQTNKYAVKNEPKRQTINMSKNEYYQFVEEFGEM